MSRFNLDPRVAPPPSPPPRIEPVAARAPAAPPPRAPAAPASDPAPPASRRKMLLVGGVALALLLVGGAVALYAATLGYPSQYLLEGGEHPPGYADARLSASELDALGIEENPGRMSQDSLSDAEHDLGREDGHAEEAHLQVLSASGNARVLVFAARYANEEDAQSAANDLRVACSFADAAVLRDGNVLVTVIPDDGATRTHVRAVGNALRAQNGDLGRVCGL